MRYSPFPSILHSLDHVLNPFTPFCCIPSRRHLFKRKDLSNEFFDRNRPLLKKAQCSLVVARTIPKRTMAVQLLFTHSQDWKIDDRLAQTSLHVRSTRS